MLEFTSLNSPAIIVAVFVVAVLYASVGHGGASGYLAVLALFSLPTSELSGTALLLNVLVSTIAFASFMRAGHRPPQFVWLLVAVSVPFAFAGGAWKISSEIYRLLLALALLGAALRLAFAPTLNSDSELITPRPTSLVLAGGAIGLLSGIVGIGGGVFLSPLAIFFRWASVKSIATMSALFILVNSIAGLSGRAIADRLVIAPATGLIVAAFAGGILGAYLGSKFFSNLVIQRTLAVLLVIASLKLLLV